MSKWKRYEFDQLGLLSFVPGCYVIYGDNKPVYVGQSANVGYRLVSHGMEIERYSAHIKTTWGRFRSVFIKVRISEKYGDWAMLELRLIRKLKLRGNTRGAKMKVKHHGR